MWILLSSCILLVKHHLLFNYVRNLLYLDMFQLKPLVCQTISTQSISVCFKAVIATLTISSYLTDAPIFPPTSLAILV